ncbi:MULTISPECIES: bifunctional transcriptional activator/DNA repair enzyme AdaA [unclassified Sphingomonas]|uniref:bifunctional transcriptional activator/DNA repair enzyme AdaA n=1 Tax=unclassified Sphingomonas TaxID=196159 RepID=UPI0009E7901E|nr:MULTISPECIES: Ada metal-binding domain-containing protein [unclassified Sphingomonas]
MLDPDSCYAALERRDPAMDGRFFVGVTTTGIYCRSVCPARTPARSHARFYPGAAAAQAAGFRPCLRCRPETAPDSPAWVGTRASIDRALRLIDEGALAEGSVVDLADRLGMTDRHLRRLFERHLGAGPLAIEATRRLNLAKQLIHDTALSLTDIAFAAGFGSVRRFNEVFLSAFDRPPSALRRGGAPADPVAPITVLLALPPGATPVVPGTLSLDQGTVTLIERRGGSVRVALHGVALADLGRTIAAAKRALAAGCPTSPPCVTTSDAGNGLRSG